MKNAANTMAMNVPTKPPGVLGDHPSNRIGAPVNEFVNTISIPLELKSALNP